MVTPSASHWRLLASLLRPHARVVVVLGVVLAGGSTIPLVGPQLLRAFIDLAADGAGTVPLVAIAGAYVTLGLGAQGAIVATAYVATRLAWAATNRLREQAADHVLGLDLAFHSATSPGALVERVDGDATAITKFFTDVVVRLVGGGLTLAGALLLVTREDWRVGLAMAVFVAAAMAVVVRLRDHAVPSSEREREVYSHVVGLVAEQLEGGEDLRALGARDHALSRHDALAAEHVDAAVDRERRAAHIWSAANGFFAVGGALMLGAGWLLLESGTITLGTVFLLFAYTQVIRRPVELIAEQLKEVQQAAAGAARMGALLEVQPDLPPGGTARLPDGALDVRFHDVTFAYDDGGADGTVLHGVDLHLPAGTVTGLVGTTGSGKTTLARLALRLIDPTSGSVELAGVDLREVDDGHLRHRLAIVTQDVQVLDGTVRDNLTLFSDDHDDSGLTALLHELGLGPWLDGLPDGLDTHVGSGTAGLSAGEGQLLGLGRAFLADPGLVVLDEASSRIDPATAEVVETALDRLLEGRTAMVIAHRLRAIDRADAVVVLDHGRVVEHGPRSGLAADPTSRFAALLALESEEVSA